MNRNTQRFPGILAAILAFGIAGCAAPDFVVDVPFTQPLKNFQRIEVRPAAVALEKAAASKEQADGARAFSAAFGPALVHRLHRWKVLDGADGAWLKLEVRILKYEWEVGPGTAELPPQVTGWVGIAVTFKDEAGATLGSGGVTAVEHGSTPQVVMESAEKKVVSSAYKFIRKSVGRKGTPEPSERPEPEVSP